ncbi:hypothetical protein PHMEG_00032416, partial [Phytophthora megakarya]
MTRGASQLTTKKDGNRPPISEDTPVANKTLGQCLNARLDTSSWIQLFAPKAARQAVWAELVEELSHPVNSTSTSQVAEDTVSLLMAMGMEAHAYPSSTALADWTASEAGTELQRWKRKLKTAKNESSEHSVAEDAEEDHRAVFGSAEPSPYFYDSHMVTPRAESRKARVAQEAEQTESTANIQPGAGRNSSRRQVAADDSSSDEDNPFYQADDENNATTELARQVRELTAMKEMDPTPRFEITQHRPLGKITPFRGKLDESENSMQWLRGFVYEMKALSRKTKRTWSLLSDKFISYYCSQFSQSASTRYYRAKRSEKEHIRDYLNRLNGYARSANIKFERSGREAKEHVKHILEIPDEYSNDYSNDDPSDFYEEARCKARILIPITTRDWLQLLTTMNVEMLLTGHLRGVTSVPKAMDNSQVDLVKVDFDLQLNLVRGSTITVVDAVFRDQVMVHALHVVDRIIPRTFVSDDVGKCEAFDELAKILQTNVDKKNIIPELQKLVF